MAEWKIDSKVFRAATDSGRNVCKCCCGSSQTDSHDAMHWPCLAIQRATGEFKKCIAYVSKLAKVMYKLCYKQKLLGPPEHELIHITLPLG